MSDSDLGWKGWHRNASESLLQATVGDDPHYVEIFAQEAITAGKQALSGANNQRQIDVSVALLDAAHKVRDRAKLTTGSVMEDEV